MMKEAKIEVRPGVNRVGGKFKLVKTLLKLTPGDHEYFFSLFLGSGIYEYNRPRVKSETFNDVDSELINYFITIQEQPNEFEEYKKGIYGIVSQEIFNRILKGEIKPKDNVQRAYFFYYINKLSFAGLMKGYRGITQPTVFKKKNQFNSKYMGLNLKTTRPYTNNDNGLLSPIDNKLIKRMRYINFTCYHFKKFYEMYERALLKKNIINEVFFYADPPYPKKEMHYEYSMNKEDHEKLIEILQKTKFKFMLSIGGECDFYLNQLSNFYIIKAKTKYSLDSNSQDEIEEFIILNYNPQKIIKVKKFGQKSLTKFIEVE